MTTQIDKLKSQTLTDPRWNSVVQRSAVADGKFFYSVKTTGVYCRPSCGARLARPENVQFHLTIHAAEECGFRPCKRCKPDQPSLKERNATLVSFICRLIEESTEVPSLAQLAEIAGMSLYHFHRCFKSVTGVTPADYAKAHRGNLVRASLETSPSVTDAIYDAGFSSSSRFYENSNDLLGMTPSKFRAAGKNTEIYFAIGECSLGAILVAQSDVGVCAILMGDDPTKLIEELQDKFSEATLHGAEKKYEALVATVVGMIERPGLGFDLPLDIRGTAFQQRVWRALQQIPPGDTATYAEIAQKIGMPTASRAVAQACGANSLAVAIPCHRVIRTDGSLSGYRWGVDRKQALLEREAQRA